jgi:uncharacterized protein YjbI with pentapeptide repeats
LKVFHAALLKGGAAFSQKQTTTMLQIKSRFSGQKVLFEYESDKATIKEALTSAVKEGANLEGADLEGAYLEGADLRGTNLKGANLEGAYLEGANLEGANLEGANLRCANLEGAYLEGADLRGAGLIGANLEGSCVEGVYLEGADDWDIPTINNIHQKVYKAASAPNALDMGDWHNSCGTTHCRAGWVTTLSGEKGKALENKVGPELAGYLIYRKSDPSAFAINFFADNATAMADMKAMAEKEAAKTT